LSSRNKKKGNTNHKKRNHKQHSRYLVITKIANNPDRTAKCVKYRCTDLLKYVQFLDLKFPFWTWTNVYSNLERNKYEQLGSFTSKNRPVSSSI